MSAVVSVVLDSFLLPAEAFCFGSGGFAAEFGAAAGCACGACASPAVAGLEAPHPMPLALRHHCSTPQLPGVYPLLTLLPVVPKATDQEPTAGKHRGLGQKTAADLSFAQCPGIFVLH